jgi:hypothetical protein
LDSFVLHMQHSTVHARTKLPWAVGPELMTPCPAATTTRPPSSLWLQQPTPTTTCWMDQNNEPVAWRGQVRDHVVFASGEPIPVAQRVFDADPSGSYFVLGGEGRFTWLGRVRDPHVRHLVSAYTFGLSVFVASNRIYVGGTPYGKDPIRSSPGTRCLVFKDTEDGFVLLERHNFPSASAVLDVAQDGEKPLLKAGGDLYSRLVVYDMKSRKQTRVGTAKAFSFLLVSDPAASPVDG